jgi:hypothetical protein
VLIKMEQAEFDKFILEQSKCPVEALEMKI